MDHYNHEMANCHFSLMCAMSSVAIVITLVVIYFVH